MEKICHLRQQNHLGSAEVALWVVTESQLPDFGGRWHGEETNLGIVPLADPELTIESRLALNLWWSSCLSLLNVKFVGMNYLPYVDIARS